MDLHFQVTGSGEPIIFVHGFSLDSRMWQPQVEDFSRSHRVVTYDLRGFGQSPLPTGTYSHHLDLFELATHLAIPSFHLVGLSLGGEIALDFVLTYPSMVKSLTLADSSLGGYASTVDWRVYAQEQGLAQAKENWLNHSVFASCKNNPTVLSTLKNILADYSGWHWLNSDPRLKLDPPTITRLSEIKVPTQILVGEHDLSYYHDIAKILTQNIRDSRFHIISNSGHMTNLENTTEFNQLVSQNLSR